MTFEIVSTPQWLLMLANELESKGYPPAYGPQLRHASEILGSSEQEIFKLDNANIQLNLKAIEQEKEFKKLHLDMAILWARYQKAIEIVSRYEPETAVTMAEYKPRFHDTL
jgi:hypothetical protein